MSPAGSEASPLQACQDMQVTEFNRRFLAQLQARLGEKHPVIAAAQAALILRREVDKVERIRKEAMDEARARLLKENPMQANIEWWMCEQMRDLEQAWDKEHEWDALNAAKADMQGNASLSQAHYILERHLEFVTNESGIKAATEVLQAQTQPVRAFESEIVIWFPENWEIKQRRGPDGKAVYYAQQHYTLTCSTANCGYVPHFTLRLRPMSALACVPHFHSWQVAMDDSLPQYVVVDIQWPLYPGTRPDLVIARRNSSIVLLPKVPCWKKCGREHWRAAGHRSWNYRGQLLCAHVHAHICTQPA